MLATRCLWLERGATGGLERPRGHVRPFETCLTRLNSDVGLLGGLHEELCQAETGRASRYEADDMYYQILFNPGYLM